MTRKSKREIERALESLTDDNGGDNTSPESLEDTHREAVREALAYRYQGGELAGDPWGDRHERREFLETAAGHVDEPHSTVLEDFASGIEP